MKTKCYIELLLIAVLGTLLLCGDTEKPEEQGDDPVPDYSLVGLWETRIPPRPGSVDTLVVNFDLARSDNADSTFFLYATENTEGSIKPLYERRGVWGIRGTSVELTGTNCQMIDINETTYELKQAVDSICNLVISIDTTDTTEKIDSIWYDIPLVNLGGIVKSFPIYAVFPGWCESLRCDFAKIQSRRLP